MTYVMWISYVHQVPRIGVSTHTLDSRLGPKKFYFKKRYNYFPKTYITWSSREKHPITTYVMWISYVRQQPRIGVSSHSLDGRSGPKSFIKNKRYNYFQTMYIIWYVRSGEVEKIKKLLCQVLGQSGDLKKSDFKQFFLLILKKSRALLASYYKNNTNMHSFL